MHQGVTDIPYNILCVLVEQVYKFITRLTTRKEDNFSNQDCTCISIWLEIDLYHIIEIFTSYLIIRCSIMILVINNSNDNK